MYQALIKNYITNLTPIQVKQFAEKNHVVLTEEETNYMTNFVKTNWHTLLYGDPTPLFLEAKKHIRSEIYEMALQGFQEAKQKYQSFL